MRMVLLLALIVMEIARVFSLKTIAIVMNSRNMNSEKALKFAPNYLKISFLLPLLNNFISMMECCCGINDGIFSAHSIKHHSPE